jgi:hypothetical protein
MTEEFASLKISIEANMSNFSTKMEEFNRALQGSEKQAKETGNAFTTMAQSWQNTAKGFISGQFVVDGIKSALDGLKSAIIGSFKAFDDEAVMMKRLELSLGDGAKALKNYAIAIEGKTRFTDDDILQASNSLTIHKLNREEIEKLMPVIVDFATKAGRDATSTAEAFGRAIEFGTTRGLRPFGIEVEKDGSAVDMFNAIIEQGQGNVKGLAEEVGALGLGPITILTNQLEDLTKVIGEPLAEALNAMMPIFTAWVSGFSELVTAWAHGVSTIIETTKKGSVKHQVEKEADDVVANALVSFGLMDAPAASLKPMKREGDEGFIGPVKSRLSTTKRGRKEVVKEKAGEDAMGPVEAYRAEQDRIADIKFETSKQQQKIDEDAYNANLKKTEAYLDKKQKLYEEDIQRAMSLSQSMGSLLGASLSEAIIGDQKGFKEGLKSMLITLVDFGLNALKVYQGIDTAKNIASGPIGWGKAILELAVIEAAGGLIKGAIRSFGGGGYVMGASHGAGGQAINVEGGEYVMSRNAVKMYGVQNMSAINAGRAASPAAGSKGGSGTTIINTIDPGLMERYMASSAGQKAIVNVMRAKRYEIAKGTK